MTDALTIVLAQINQVLGGFSENADLMMRARARVPHADLIVFPEASLVGYPLEDLVLKPALAHAAQEALEALARLTDDGGPAMLVGSVMRIADGRIFNIMALLTGGTIAAITRKHELPNYGTFDEKRVFAPGPLPGPLSLRGVRIGVPICEDIWFPDVCDCLAETGAEILIVPNGSPFEVGKDDKRLQLALTRVQETGLPLAYVNRIGGQDELAFDGASFVLNADCTLAHQLADWEERIVETHWQRSAEGWVCDKGLIEPLDTDLEGTYHAMMTGLRDYVDRNGFKGVVLGLSGGIDSALSAAIAADALGAARVWCVMLPSPFTSAHSREDAAQCAQALGVRLDTMDITPVMESYQRALDPLFKDMPSDTTEENLQSRIRGAALMALSNKFGFMLLTTGNKSEMSVGYATLYGDMCGGYSVLKDVYKTTVFALSRWRNATIPTASRVPALSVIPERIITKAPTAELRANQTDQDSLPPYEELDAILKGFVEDDLSAEGIIAKGFDPNTVAHVERLLNRAEFKRRQAPPGVKISSRNFGRDRRYPISHRFRSTP